MADDSDDVREWVVEPPAPGEVTLFMATGDGVELTDEQQAAISGARRKPRRERCRSHRSGSVSEPHLPARLHPEVLRCSNQTGFVHGDDRRVHPDGVVR